MNISIKEETVNGLEWLQNVSRFIFKARRVKIPKDLYVSFFTERENSQLCCEMHFKQIYLRVRIKFSH
jgi:hypothetical protein